MKKVAAICGRKDSKLILRKLVSGKKERKSDENKISTAGKNDVAKLQRGGGQRTLLIFPAKE